MDNKNILVLGGAGYIGSHIVADLCELGYNVTVFDNLSTGFRSNVHGDAHFIKGDILIETELLDAFSSPYDGVFHFAALKAAGDSMKNPDLFSDINISGSMQILKMVKNHHIKNFIFFL